MKYHSKIASFFNALFINFRHARFIQKIESVVHRMNPGEKIAFAIAAIVLVVSGISLLVRVSDTFLIEVPKLGGEFTEGVIGSPRFINPVLAISDTDRDLSSLIYSGLLKSTVKGEIVPDLAESYSVSEDGKVYDVYLKDNAMFHDGEKVTADDVIFTIEKILDPVIKSPKKALWDGVLVEKTSETEIKFTLGKPYAPFLEALTIGILPKHLWQETSSEEFPFAELNLSPVGSGPYKIEKMVRNGSGIPTEISLSSYKKYALNRPKIKSIIFKFFQNEGALAKAYEEGSVENMVVSPITATEIDKNKAEVSEASLPRVFGVFLNQNLAPVFLNKEIRTALETSAPKERILDEVLYGFGRPLNGPTPSYTEELQGTEITSSSTVEIAKTDLLEAGWKENTDGILEKKGKSGTAVFSFSISTSDSPELKKTAEILKETWEKLGASIDIKIFEASDLSQNIIKGRKYDALLFGEAVSEESDLFPFWHSSERLDPGLNISLYANITADQLLLDIQKSQNKNEILQKKEELVSEIKKDVPAIFLFSPSLIYVESKNIKNSSFKAVSSQNERFAGISDWYIETEKIWKFLNLE